MEHKACQKRVSPCGKITIFVENDAPLSAYHDYMLSQKGEAVDQMVKIQKEQEEEAKEHMSSDCCKEE